MKASDLIGSALDWAVAKCEGENPAWLEDLEMFANCRDCGSWNYSTNWAQGGPIIEREDVLFLAAANHRIMAFFRKTGTSGKVGFGDTHLVAMARLIVTSRLGDEVEIPEELQ